MQKRGPALSDSGLLNRCSYRNCPATLTFRISTEIQIWTGSKLDIRPARIWNSVTNQWSHVTRPQLSSMARPQARVRWIVYAYLTPEPVVLGGGWQRIGPYFKSLALASQAASFYQNFSRVQIAFVRKIIVLRVGLRDERAADCFQQ